MPIFDESKLRMPFYTGEELDALHSPIISTAKMEACEHLIYQRASCWTSRETLLAQQLRHFLDARQEGR